MRKGHLRVRAKLVATVDGILNDIGVVVDGTKVVAVHEEGALHVGSVELVENRLGEGEWTIIKGDGDGVGNSAAGDDSANGDSVLAWLLDNGLGSGPKSQSGEKSSGEEHDEWIVVIVVAIEGICQTK